MITFKEYFQEAYLDPHIKPTTGEDWNLTRGVARIRRSQTTDIGESETHTFHKVDLGDDKEKEHRNAIYYAKNKKNKNIDLTVNASEVGNDVNVDTMSKHKNGEMRMHHFLHHLIQNHDKRIGSDQFSAGGKKTFDSLAAMKGIKTSSFKNHVESGHPNYDDSKKDEDWSYVVAHKE
jgi:hypothetical protein